MTSDELNAAIATFDNRADALVAANAAMPRRKHNRPYPNQSGWHWARAVPCPTCGAAEGIDCTERLHRERETAARAAGRAADRWIVYVGNAVLLRDGTMYDHQRQTAIRA